VRYLLYSPLLGRWRSRFCLGGLILLIFFLANASFNQRIVNLPCLSWPPSPAQLPLSNRYGAPECEGQANEDVGEAPSRGLPRMSQSAPHIMTAPVKKKRRVIVTGDSLLRGAECLICQPGPPCREFCCLAGAWVRDVAGKLPGLVWPSDY